MALFRLGKRFPQSANKAITALVILLAGGMAIFQTNTSAAVNPSPSPTPSPSSLQPSNIPVASDTSLPKIQQLIATASRSGSQFTISLGLNVQVHLNAVRSITIKFAPRYNAAARVDPSLCTLPSNVSSTGSGATSSAPSLQSRTIVGSDYLEVHTIVSTTTLSLGQDICMGDYLLTSIALTDIAGHDLTITSNQAATTNTSLRASTNTDTPVEQSTLWQKFPTLAPCPALSNVAPVASTQNKSAAPTVSTQTLTRSTCDQNINFSAPLFSVQSGGISASAIPAVPNPNNVSGKDGNLPLIDYASQIKTNQDLIQSLTSKNSQLLSQIKSLQNQLKKNSPGTGKTFSKGSSKVPTPKASRNSLPTPRSTALGKSTHAQSGGSRHWTSGSGGSGGSGAQGWAMPSSSASPKK